MRNHPMECNNPNVVDMNKRFAGVCVRATEEVISGLDRIFESELEDFNQARHQLFLKARNLADHRHVPPEVQVAAEELKQSMAYVNVAYCGVRASMRRDK